MTLDLRLALRLLLGGGRAGAVRLLLMAGGTAVAVTADLTIAQLPGVLADRDAVIADRQPIPATGERQQSDFDYLYTELSWEGEPLTRVFVAAGASSPAPAGLDGMPRPGEVALSPGAANLAEEPAFRALVPGRVVATIADPGLVEPEELIAYVGVPAEDIGQPSLGTAWGVPAGTDVAGTRQFQTIALELSLLVLPAALIYLASCARLAAATRRRRYAALRLVGTSVRTLRRVAYVEASVATVAGCLLGVAVFAVLDGPIGRNGLIGVRWFPERQPLDPAVVVALLAVALIATRAAALASSRRASVDPLAERRAQVDRPARWWMLLPLTLGVSLLVPWLPVGSPREVGDSGSIIVAGAVLCTVGVLAAARLVVSAAARVLTTPRFALGVRLGARRLLVDSASAIRLVAGLALLVLVLVLVAGIGTGLVVSSEQAAASEVKPISIHVYGSDVLPDQRDAVRELGDGSRTWLTVNSMVVNDPSAPDDGTPQWAIDHLGVRLFVAPCDEIEALTGHRSECAPDRLYRIDTGVQPPLPSGVDVPFRRDGDPLVLTAPMHSIRVDPDSDASTSGLLYTGRSAPEGWATDTTFYFVVPPGLDSLDQFSTRLAQVAPSATANASVDLRGVVTAFRVHRDVLGFGTTVSFGLGVLAALIALLDRNIERRRLVVDLVTLGTPTRTIRAAQVAFAAVPMLVLGSLAAGVGFLVANVIAAADTGDHRWLWSPLGAEAPLLFLGLVASVLASLVTVGTTPRAEDLRHE